MLCAGCEHDAFSQLRIIEHCTSNDRDKINSKKIEILQVNKKNKELNLKLFDENIIENQNIKHLGLECQKHNRTNIESRTSTTRATMYSLMGTGLHEINDIKNALRNRSLKYDNRYPKMRKLSKKDPETITLTSTENS